MNSVSLTGSSPIVQVGNQYAAEPRKCQFPSELMLGKYMTSSQQILDAQELVKMRNFPQRFLTIYILYTCEYVVLLR